MTQIKEILMKLLQNALDSPLSLLEDRAQEHFESINVTSSCFNEFNKQIEEIVKEEHIEPASIKAKEPDKSQKEPKTIDQSLLVRNYTVSNFKEAAQKQEPKVAVAFKSIKPSAHVKTECCAKKNANHSTVHFPQAKLTIQPKTFSAKDKTQALTQRGKGNNHIVNTITKPFQQSDKVKNKLINSKTVKDLKDKKPSIDSNTTATSEKNFQQGKMKLKENIKNTTINSMSKKNSNDKTQRQLKTTIVEKKTEKAKYISKSIINKSIDNYSFALNGNKPVYSVVLEYLSLKEQILLFSSCKLFKANLSKVIQDQQNTIQSKLNINNSISIEDKIKEATSKYKTQELDAVPPFKFSRQAEKALALLNEKIYSHLFKKEILEDSFKPILIVFRIFFLLISNDYLISIENDTKFWKECCKYFNSLIDKDNGKLGSNLISLSNSLSFDNCTVFKISNLSYEHRAKLNPTYFQNISGTVSLMAFLIKDALEYSGVLSSQMTPPWRVISNLNYDKNALSLLNQYQTIAGGL